MSLLAGQVHFLSATTPVKRKTLNEERNADRNLHSAFSIVRLKQAALVLPQAGWVLETLLHELVRGLLEWRF